MALVTDVTSSQGFSAFGVSNAKKVSVKKARSTGGGSAATPKLDASTLAIAHGGTKVYEDGLDDPGNTTSSDGIVVTATIEVFGTPPSAGSTISVGGATLKCTDSTTTNDVGALRTGTASYTSEYTS